MFRTLRDHDGTPTIALDADELAADGVIFGDKEIPPDKRMHIRRVDEGVYLVRDVDEVEGIRDLPERLV